MRSMTLGSLLLFFMGACYQPPDGPGDSQVVESAMRNFSEHIAAFDYDGIRDAVTPDVEMIEDTLRLDRDGFVEYIREMDGQASLAFELEEFITEFAGQLAYTSYRLKAVVTVDEQNTPAEWLESAVFRWTDGEWKIDRLQSTPVHDQRP